MKITVREEIRRIWESHHSYERTDSLIEKSFLALAEHLDKMTEALGDIEGAANETKCVYKE